MTAGLDPLPSILNSPAVSQLEIVSREIELRYSDLRTGVQVIVARSGYAEGQEKIIDIAEDILHDAIESVLTAAEKFDAKRSVYAWLIGIAINKLRERRRDAWYDIKRVQVFDDSGQDDNDPVAANSKERSEDATSEERIDAVLYGSTYHSVMEDQEQGLDEMLALVKESDRRILKLAIVDGLSGADLAAVYGIREGAAYVRLARAKERLRGKYLSIQARKD